MKMLKINDNLWVFPDRVDNVLTTALLNHPHEARNQVRISQSGISYFVEECKTQDKAQAKAESLAKLIGSKRER